MLIQLNDEILEKYIDTIMLPNWIFMVLVAVVAYLWYPSNEHNLLVLVNTNTFALSRLMEIKNIKAAFKMTRNVYEEMRQAETDNKDTQVMEKYLFL